MGLRRGDAKLRALIRRRRFIKQYVNGPPEVAGNAPAAVIAARFTDKANSAATIASKFLHDPQTQVDIARALDRAGATDQRITEEITRIALGDPREVQEWGEDYHRFVPSRLLDNHSAATVRGVESVKTERVSERGVTTETRLKMIQHDKVAALALLTKIRGMVRERFEHTGRDGGPIEHAVRFYLPAPARAREPVVVEPPRALPSPGAPQNGSARSSNGGSPEPPRGEPAQ